jgi:hypothetical protein
MSRGGFGFLCSQVYNVVAEHAVVTPADEEPEAAGSSAPRWKRNVRNFLQAHKDLEIEWAKDESSYRWALDGENVMQAQLGIAPAQVVPDARAVLDGLIGRELRTVTGVANTVLSVDDTNVFVATARSPNGQPVPIAWVQDGLDLLARTGDVEVHPDTLEHRSAFVGAVLLSLPGTLATRTSPPHIVLTKDTSATATGSATASTAWHLSPGDTIVRTELHDLYGGSRQGGTIPSRTSPNIFLFLDKKVGGAHGYFDGWAAITSTTPVTARRAIKSFGAATRWFSAT